MTSAHQHAILAFIKRVSRRLRIAMLLERGLVVVTVLLTVLLLGAGSLPAQVLTPGTLYALVFDLSISPERVATVDPTTGALTPVGAGIPDCCLIGGFPGYWTVKKRFVGSGTLSRVLR